MTPQEVIERFRHLFDLGEISEFNKKRMVDILQQYRDSNPRKVIKVVHKPAKIVYVDKMVTSEKAPSLDEIQRIVCEKYGITPEQLRRNSPTEAYFPHKRRSRIFCDARYEFVKLCQQWPSWYTLKSIANYMGYIGKHSHASIIHLINRYKLPYDQIHAKAV